MDINDNNTSSDNNVHKEKVAKLLDVAKLSNNEATNSFIKAQKSISNNICINYASVQFNKLNTMSKIGENIDDIESISKFIIDKKMVTMTKSIVTPLQSGKNQLLFDFFSSF